jgi:hypothetical protein
MFTYEVHSPRATNNYLRGLAEYAIETGGSFIRQVWIETAHIPIVQHPRKK